MRGRWRGQPDVERVLSVVLNQQSEWVSRGSATRSLWRGGVLLQTRLLLLRLIATALRIRLLDVDAIDVLLFLGRCAGRGSRPSAGWSDLAVPKPVVPVPAGCVAECICWTASGTVCFCVEEGGGDKGLWMDLVGYWVRLIVVQGEALGWGRGVCSLLWDR